MNHNTDKQKEAHSEQSIDLSLVIAYYTKNFLNLRREKNNENSLNEDDIARLRDLIDMINGVSLPERSDPYWEPLNQLKKYPKYVAATVALDMMVSKRSFESALKDSLWAHDHGFWKKLGHVKSKE